jgi:hypothetical protein
MELKRIIVGLLALLVLQVASEQPALSQHQLDEDAAFGFRTIDDRAVVATAHIWPTRNIPVCWENPQQRNLADRQLVIRAVSETWERHSAVRFVQWGLCNPRSRGIRILIADAGPRTLGLGSQLDRKPHGMLLNFTFANWKRDCRRPEARRQFCIRSIAVHEFGHALAFAHEQNRWDTPGECAKLNLTQGSQGDLQLTRWDPESVMNYCTRPWVNNGELSANDQFAVAEIYGDPE